MFDPKDRSLEGKRGIVLGVANDESIAYGCARAFHDLGAEVALTYVNEKSKRFVDPIAEELGAEIYLPCDVTDDAQMAAVFDAAREKWGSIDFALHSIAFAPKDDLHGRLVDSSREGFSMAMDISCHSFMRMARLAEPLMTNGGALFTMSYYGAEKVVKNYNLMGPVKAALECAVRYMAHELGPKGIRVLAISPGPVRTRAASGLRQFDDLVSEAAERAPTHQLAGIDDVGIATAALATPAAKMITGETIYIDGGYHVMG